LKTHIIKSPDNIKQKIHGKNTTNYMPTTNNH